MELDSRDELRFLLIIPRSTPTLRDRSSFYRAVEAGHFVRVTRGAYLPAAVWRSLDADERFRARIHAIAAVSSGRPIFSHCSAAAMWRLPMVDRWPDRPDVLAADNRGGHARALTTARHFGIIDDPDVIDGVRVTPLARTVVDMARIASTSCAVAMADRALAASPSMSNDPASIRTSRAELLTVLRSSSPRGRRRAALALEFADGASGSPGESVSRVAMHLLGLPRPVLQQAFRDDRGPIGVVDFWWPEFNLIGEFDGTGKYLRDEFREGRSEGQIVVQEKWREDRLRALGHRVTRWGWSVARSLPRLEAQLRTAGLG